MVSFRLSQHIIDTFCDFVQDILPSLFTAHSSPAASGLQVTLLVSINSNGLPVPIQVIVIKDNTSEVWEDNNIV